jgi:phosphoglycolate phosphatase
LPPLLETFDLLVFDLDGTLAETREDIHASVNYALGTLGRPPLGLDAVSRYVGNGARVLIERALGSAARPKDVEEVLDSFLAHYGEHCLERTRLYPGVEDGLRRLAGRPLGVLTNKPLRPTTKILSGLGILHAFAAVVGGDSAPAKKPDPRGLLSLCSRFGAAPGRTLLVGDTAVDVETARNAGTRVAGVSYGFRPEDFAASPPDYEIQSFGELLALRV